jgi:hypothetical protein
MWMHLQSGIMQAVSSVWRRHGCMETDYKDMSFDVAVANEKKGTNWKIVNNTWGGEDLGIAEKLLLGADSPPSTYALHDGGKVLLKIDTKEKTIDLNMTEIDQQRYSVRTHKR